MGCSPSKAVIVQSSTARKTYLCPTIFMVGEKSLQVLQELGELKFYQLAENDASEEIASSHSEFAARLENPLQYARDTDLRVSADNHLDVRDKCAFVNRVVQVEEQNTKKETVKKQIEVKDLFDCVTSGNKTTTSNAVTLAENTSKSQVLSWKMPSVVLSRNDHVPTGISRHTIETFGNGENSTTSSSVDVNEFRALPLMLPAPVDVDNSQDTAYPAVLETSGKEVQANEQQKDLKSVATSRFTFTHGSSFDKIVSVPDSKRPFVKPTPRIDDDIAKTAKAKTFLTRNRVEPKCNCEIQRVNPSLT